MWLFKLRGKKYEVQTNTPVDLYWVRGGGIFCHESFPTEMIGKSYYMFASKMLLIFLGMGKKGGPKEHKVPLELNSGEFFALGMRDARHC